MFKVWYNICGEYHEEFFYGFEEAKEAFNHAIEIMHTMGDYVEIDDLEADCFIESFENGAGDWDDVDESNYDPYMGQDIIEREEEIW